MFSLISFLNICTFKHYNMIFLFSNNRAAIAKALAGLKAMQNNKIIQSRKFVKSQLLSMNDSQDVDMDTEWDSDSNSQYSKVSDKSINSQTSNLEQKDEDCTKRIEHCRKEGSEIRSYAAHSLIQDIKKIHRWQITWFIRTGSKRL